MNEIKIDLSKCIDNFKIDKDKAKQYGGYKKIANDLSKENIKLAFENTILQSKIDKAIDKLESLLPMCIMPNNMLIHGTEKAKAIEETLDILKEDE